MIETDRKCAQETMEKVDERRLDISAPSDNEQVVLTVRCLAAKAGFSKNLEFLIAAAASELATNIIRYAKKGEVFIRIVTCEGRTGLEILARDQGPGIADIELAMGDGYTTTPKSLGMGLPSVRRIMDEFSIDSAVGRGTCILTRKWR